MAVHRLHELLPHQQKVFNCDAKYRIWAKGRRCGGTECGVFDLSVHMAYKTQGDAIIVLPKSKEQAVNVYWDRLCQILPQVPYCINTKKKWHNDANHIINTRRGYKIFLFSGSKEAVEGMRGISEIEYILLDEVGNFDRYSWTDVIHPMMLNSKRTRALFLSSPNGVGNIFHELYLAGEKGNAGDPLYAGYRSFHSTSYDNTTLDIQELDRIKAQYGEDSITWRKEYMANFCSVSGAVFPKFGKDNITIKATYKDTSDWTTFAAVDYGFRRGVTILFQVNRFTSNVNIFGEYYGMDRGFEECAKGQQSQKQHLFEACKLFKIDQIFTDCAGNQHSQQTGQSMTGILRAAGLNNVCPVGKTKDDFRDYTEQIRRLICDPSNKPHLFINPDTCRWGVESLYNCRYPEKVQTNQHAYDKDGVYDHWVDAFRYAVKKLFPVMRKDAQSVFVELG